MTWAAPRFSYGQVVKIKPLEGVEARVIDLHFYGNLGSIEYDVRYFHDGREQKVRVFEDELENARNYCLECNRNWDTTLCQEKDCPFQGERSKA